MDDFKKFHDSKAFYKGIRGPSKRTAACLAEIEKNVCNQKAFENIRRIRVAVFQKHSPVKPHISTFDLPDGTTAVFEFIFAGNRQIDARKLLGLNVEMAWIRHDIPDEIVRTLGSRVIRSDHGCIIVDSDSPMIECWETNDLGKMLVELRKYRKITNIN